MSRQSPEDLSERCFRFTCDVYDYGEDLVRLRGLPCRVAYQLFDAARFSRRESRRSKIRVHEQRLRVKKCDLPERGTRSALLATSRRSQGAGKRPTAPRADERSQRTCVNLRGGYSQSPD